jgi:predicted neuraminidase
VLSKEFVFEQAPFEQCHASTLEETIAGLVAAWFAGPHEGHSEVGIWVSLHRHGRWTQPVEVATGREGGTRLACWNPVLFQPREGPLLLFYKVGPGPGEWWGMLATSDDCGASWSDGTKLPQGVLGPIKNRPIQLDDGSLLCPSSSEDGDLWCVHFESTTDGGRSWHTTPPLNDGKALGAIQPSILHLGGTRFLAIGRTRQGRMFEIESPDEGRTWGDVRLGTLPNPNSGTDACTLRGGRHVLVYNPTTLPGGERTPLEVAVSSDGRFWTHAVTLEDEPGAEFSYPTVLQTRDGLIHMVYTWKRRRIVHAVLSVGGPTA